MHQKLLFHSLIPTLAFSMHIIVPVILIHYLNNELAHFYDFRNMKTDFHVHALPGLLLFELILDQSACL